MEETEALTQARAEFQAALAELRAAEARVQEAQARVLALMYPEEVQP
jgi:hypothetical protein